MLTQEDGTTYCPMVGHSQRNCPGYPSEEHAALFRQGFGVGQGPVMTDAEVETEMRSDHELMRDEFHGRGWDNA